ncbi:heparan-sulfate 6-O-sulfotransferase 3-B-like [Rhinatrema bivittatum]|uniref:heparan-sulfate 6-O-sulfotransferase 3-B-like n=1 Tax=Rhinatrema bivittatum TaxID=194408 RepID=UPI0011295351|nr:heparan-sulfate 6-O-sulfotransferase 3-B-like [Rhinatrema bivittatum]
MDERANKLILAPILALLFVMIVYQYLCPTGANSCHFQGAGGGKPRRLPAPQPQHQEAEEDEVDEPEDGSPPKFLPQFNFSVTDLTRFVDFHMKGDDVIVFLHIQKTGGTTFGRHLVRNIRLEQPCDCKPGQKKCTCHRPGKKETWLFSRFSTGWSCGLHADWTELTNCVPAIMEKRDSQRSRSYFPTARKMCRDTKTNPQATSTEILAF